jgi:hypothetical protein
MEEDQKEEHDFEDWEDEQPQPGELPTGWLFFSTTTTHWYSATELLRKRLGVSQGAAEAKLRRGPLASLLVCP